MIDMPQLLKGWGIPLKRDDSATGLIILLAGTRLFQP